MGFFLGRGTSICDNLSKLDRFAQFCLMNADRKNKKNPVDMNINFKVSRNMRCIISDLEIIN
jgi:hypothetical protein